jgi:hypothetical protein
MFGLGVGLIFGLGGGFHVGFTGGSYLGEQRLGFGIGGSGFCLLCEGGLRFASGCGFTFCFGWVSSLVFWGFMVGSAVSSSLVCGGGGGGGSGLVLGCAHKVFFKEGTGLA